MFSLFSCSIRLHWVPVHSTQLTVKLYLFRIGRIENSPSSACGHLSSHSALSSYGLFAPLTLWQLSVSLRPLIQALESCPASGAPWSSAMPLSLGRGWDNNNNNRPGFPSVYPYSERVKQTQNNTTCKQILIAW